ncbi:hypothetical protein [Halomonas urmiana]|uniref:hypothetical protein n=1 Tax=Halomonas urmiana TaxID=490901 RepID=UPI0013054605|nr:hypothetical protein [Halomonas urmiana]
MTTRGTLAFAAIGLATIGLTGCGSVGVQPVSIGKAKPPNCQLDRYVNERDIERTYS